MCPQSVFQTELASQVLSLLSCPHCNSSMEYNGKSILCTNNHCFDLAKQGYVNLLTHGIKTKYDKELFLARKSLHMMGFYEPLDKAISTLITPLFKDLSRPLRIIDAGCGEGSHLVRIKENLLTSLGREPLGIGIDIAKEGIQLAARSYKRIFWSVGDLARCPFADKQFDILLNILSPANYGEFTRILTPEGIILKVIPAPDYLKELRMIYFEEPEKQDYSNDPTLELFRQQLDLLKIESLRYSVTLKAEQISSLIQMTPLSWGADEKAKSRVLAHNSLEVTVDLMILLGRLK